MIIKLADNGVYKGEWIALSAVEEVLVVKYITSEKWTPSADDKRPWESFRTDIVETLIAGDSRVYDIRDIPTFLDYRMQMWTVKHELELTKNKLEVREATKLMTTHRGVAEYGRAVA